MIEPVFSAEEIASRIRELGAEIRGAAAGEEVFLLGILNGAAVFLADLLRAVEGEVAYGFIDAVRDLSDTETAAALRIDFVSFTSISDRNVFVLKDVVTTGVIESYLLTQLRIHSPKSLRLVSLLDHPDMRTMDLKTDFRAFEVHGGSFAGYGLAVGSRFGNLPYIGRVT